MNMRSRPSRPALVRALLIMIGAACVVVGSIPGSGAQTELSSRHHDYRVEPLVDNLEHPWALAFLPNGDILVTERAGRLRLIRDGRLVPQPIAGVPAVSADGQGGLLDVALHPRFEDNRLVYLSFAKPGPLGATTAVARGRFEETRLADVEDVFVANAWGRGGNFFGSRLAFDREGLLYVTIGDRGEPARAQDLSDHAGSTVRLHDDGRVPADNPFVGRADALPEIYSYGHRNVQGMAVHPVSGAIWQTEHGPRGGDEVNLIRAGGNYGWPAVTYGVDYSGAPIGAGTRMPGLEEPVLHWTPAIAPSGLAFYTGSIFPRWHGDMFIAALVGQHLRRVTLEGPDVTGQETLAAIGQRIRDVRDGPDGNLYFLTDAWSGALYRLAPID